MRRVAAVAALAALFVALAAWSSQANSVLDVEMVKQIYPGADYPAPAPRELVAHDGRLFFAASDGRAGSELWKSDGTRQGTRMVRDIVSGQGSSVSGPLVSAGEWVFFPVDCTVAQPDEYAPCQGSPGYRHRQLWRSNGSARGTRLVPEAPAGVLRRSLTGVGDRLLFRRALPDSGNEIWTSDGTSAGTSAIVGSQPSGRGIDAAGLDGFALFTAYDGGHGFELWRTDGTRATTGLVADISPGPTSSNPHDLTRFGDRVYFLVGPENAGDQPAQLWRTDGTTAGTELVKNFGPNTETDGLTAAANRLFFVVEGTGRKNLWTSDGTRRGTEGVARVTEPDDYLESFDFAGLGKRIFFSAYDRRHGYRLWTSDGTRRGTSVVPGGGPAGEVEVVAAGKHVFFKGSDNEHGGELWQVGARGRRATLVRDIAHGRRGDRSSQPEWLTAVGNRLFFTADDRKHGRELWVVRP